MITIISKYAFDVIKPGFFTLCHKLANLASKAFDVIWHKRMLCKLHSIGINAHQGGIPKTEIFRFQSNHMLHTKS